MPVAVGDNVTLTASAEHRLGDRRLNRMARKLRSNAEYGNARWATRRALWRALGLTDEDIDKPKIAVVNSSSDLAICYSHLDGIAKRMKEAIRAAGAVALRGAHHRALRLRHLVGPARRLHPFRARPDHQRHRGAGRGRAARRHGVPCLLRQDPAGPADGRGTAEHPDADLLLRLSAERPVQRPPLRHRGRVRDRRRARASARCRSTRSRR